MKKVTTFKIPEAMGKELSDLLAKQSIRERVLASVIGDKEKYQELENQMIPLVQEIDTIKNKITMEYVPKEYQDPKYMWSYDGYTISGTDVTIYSLEEK